MAKDSAQSRIPRLDGVTRIPIPGAMRSIVPNQKSHIAMPPPKAIASQQRPSSYSGVGPLRTPAAALESLKKSSSGDKISEAVKKTSNIMKKFWTKPVAPASHLSDNKVADNNIIMDKEAKEDVNQKLLTRSDSGQPCDQLTHNETRTLTRSETFVRDSNTDEGRTMLSLTHNIIADDDHLSQVSNCCSEKGNDTLFITRTIDMNATAVAETSMPIEPYLKQKDTLLENVTITLPDKTPREILDRQHFSPAWTNINSTLRKCADLSADDTINLAPNKSNMKLVLNSTMNYDRLIDVSAVISPTRSLMNLTRELNESPLMNNQNANNTKLLYMSRQEDMDQTLVAEEDGDLGINQEDQYDQEELRLEDESMEVDEDLPENVAQILNANQMQEIKTGKPRYSFGMDLTEYTLDCSIELCDVSIGSSIPAQSGSPLFKKQNSFEMDESLGILTPDQMKEFLDSATTNTNLDLPINAHSSSKLAIHQMRIDQTPSPEDLPLDPVGVKTDLTDVIMSQPLGGGQHSILYNQQEISQTDSYSKTDQMSKSNVSKVSNSFITSITSITSLDTGYQGDGEMSRPASRGAGDHSPSNGPRKPHLGRQPSFNQYGHRNIPIRRQDPMTDSDFFTESDADDIFHRGDRRAQVIDGQLYGPMLQPANVFITEQPQMEDSCMESSGIFTDVENRCDDDLAQSRGDHVVVDVDMSPDGSTDTVKSNNTEYHANAQHPHPRSSSAMSQGHSNVLTDSQTSSTIQSSTSSERISISSISGVGRCGAIYAPPGVVKSSLCDAKDGENLKKTCSVTTDDKKSSTNGTCPSAKKPQTNSSLAVKKSGSSCKQRVHQYSSAAERDFNASVAANREGGKHEIKSSAKKSAVLSSPASHAARLKSRSSSANEHDYHHPSNGAEMLVKNGTSTTSPRLRDPANQENRRPNGSRAGSAGSDVANEKCIENVDVIRDRNSLIQQQQQQQQGNNSVGRKPSPNKWEAVMSKIAENKSTKKNYSQVKSKVVSGMLLRRGGTPRLTKSPANQSQDSNCGSVNSSNATSGLSSPQSKGALKQSATKRGRSFSKDSQQSSQSDLSLSGGSSSKHPVKTSPSIRSAKKRDVRTLSISPTDLGPPPKTQTNNATVRTKQQPVLAQKRTSNNNSQTTTANASPPLTTSKQGSPPPKKVISRRPQVQQTHTKVPLKDHNRLLSHPQQQQQLQNTSNSPKSGILHNIKNNTVNSSSITTTTSATTVTASPPTAGLICEGLKAGSRQSQSATNIGILHNNSSNAAHNVVSPTTVVLQQHQQQQGHKQKQPHLQIKSSKGVADYHLVHANKGFQALGVLVQYLVYDLDAFSCPKIKNDYAQTKQCLHETQYQLEEVKTTCHDLQDQLQEKELYYNTRESEIQTLHRCELEKAQTSLTELEASAQDRIKSLEAEIISKDVVNDKKLKDYMLRTEAQLTEKDQELSLARDKEQELLKRISTLSTTEDELREKVQAAEEGFAERLLDAAKRERDLAEKVNSLSKELELLRNQTCSRERELEDKLHLSHDEIAVLRNSRHLQEHSLSPKKSPVANGTATKLQMLQEVESLRSVLELKQTELSDLRKQNHELKRASDDVPLLQMRISAMESRLEDLQIQLKAKTEEEKELISRNKHLQESYKQELETRGRLSLHNEELQWRLKQNSEKFALALNELSKSYNEQGGSFLNASKTSLHSSGHGDNLQQQFSGGADNQQPLLSSSHNSSLASLNRTNGLDRMVGCFQMDDVSPPPSPIIKGVVEKNDSVSWVLEMDDETPEVLASRMIRRAGSFRSSFNEKSPNARRQYSLPATTGANPLMQSASATSVMRQHSSESVALMNSSAPATTNSRIRSKSVTIKSSEPKKFTRQNSNGAEPRTTNGGATCLTTASSWKDPICSSSPYTRNERTSSSSKHQLVSPTSATALGFTRRSPFCHDDDDGLYRKPYEASNLITCDTSALTAAEHRLEMRALPSHPSVQDLKGLKKCHEILESAGEAMVSGTNSEDEGCSASSDDIISSASSADSASSLDCNATDRKHGMLSLEDAIMNKMNTSLGGTPMEVSWSDDVDQFQNGESIV